MQAQIGCQYISDLTYHKRAVWLEMKRLCLSAYPKKQLEDLKSGKIQIEEGYIPSSDIHPESAYLWIMPYTIVEVGVLVFYLVYRQD